MLESLAVAPGAGLYAEQSADPKSLLMALGMVGDVEQGATMTRFTRAG